MKADEAFKLTGRRAETVPAVLLRTPRWRGVRSSRWAGWLFVLPALLVYAAFVLYPLALTVLYSTQRWNGIGESQYVGIDNYVRVLTDPDLVGIILNAFKLIVFFSAVPVILGLLVASLIRRVATGALGSASRTVLFRHSTKNYHQLTPTYFAASSYVFTLIVTSLTQSRGKYLFIYLQNQILLIH
jgi:ABC-type sugar transport system permease subunit